VPKNQSANGWRDGRDPVQRWLRIVTTIVVLGVFVWIALGESRQNDILVLALALGALMVLLGYEGVVRLPYIGKDDNDR
jgi:hypothetical protein